MNKYVALLRGVNVGGKNKIPMNELKICLEELGFKNVLTYINSGNVIFETDSPADKAAKQIEEALSKKFKLDSELIRALVISKDQLAAVAKKAPKGFGKEPDKYYSDVVFLIDVPREEAYKAFEPNPEVDAVWPGPGVVYFRRLSAMRTKSRISKIVGKPVYKNMTIRSWSTTIKLLSLMEKNI